jgi:hypothetical protein
VKKKIKVFLLALICVSLLLSCASTHNNSHTSNADAESVVRQHYELIMQNRIDEAYEMLHFEPQFTEDRAFGANYLRDWHDDWSSSILEILGSEQLNDNITAVYVTFYHPDSDAGVIRNATNSKIFVMHEDGEHRVILGDYNIPERLREGITIEDGIFRSNDE